jgi:septum formation topological specificity factor MinE
MEKKKITLVEEYEDEPEQDFKAQLAALIAEKRKTAHPDCEALELISQKFIKVVENLMELKDDYVNIHRSTEIIDGVPYEIEQVQLAFNYVIHECNKVTSCLQNELTKAKNLF